jgi:hypothetical protein
MYKLKLPEASHSLTHTSLILHTIMKPLLPTSTETGSSEYLQFNLPMVNSHFELVVTLAGSCIMVYHLNTGNYNKLFLKRKS